MQDKIINVIRQCEATVSMAKALFETAIINPAVPLTDRWELFVEAPDYLKNHDMYIRRIFDTKDHDYIVTYGGIYHAERYQTVKTVNVVEAILEYSDDQALENYDVYAAKERVLANNLGSFVYDW